MTRRAAALATIAACALAVAGPATLASAAGTTGRSAVSRPAGPGARWLKFGGRPAAAGERTMIAQAPAASAGADSATATGSVHTLIEVWNGSTWTQQTAPN
jgi:hypothetical protein